MQFYFRFRFLRLHHHRHVILHLPTKIRPNRNIRNGVMASYPFFKMATTAPQFYFRFRFSWFRSSGKIEICLYSKFRRDISIHGWDITTSGFWKQTSAMLQFYFRFRFLRLRHHRHIILHLPTKFRPNRTIRDGVMTSYPFFQDGSHGIAILLPVSLFVISLISEGRNIFVYQIWTEYHLSPRLRYYYFRFLKANMLEFYFLFQYLRLRYHVHVILYLSTKLRPNRTIRDRVMTSYSFFKMAAVSHIKLFQGYCRLPTKCKWGSLVGPQISTRSDL